MKKIFSLFLIISLVFPVLQTRANQADDNYFVVTAYYSPLPDQEYYITGNYEAELRLNGRWIAWASGKWVFSWMLAAPGKYSFGTKIYLEGLGIWAVEDRGWAIVPAGERWYSYDRIDVWMGYGDEGLLRANFWGKRKVYGYVVDEHNNTNIDYTSVPAPSWATTGLQKVASVSSTNTLEKNNTPEQVINETPEVFSISLGIWSNSDLITQMQEVFVELGYIKETTWEYDTATISAVYDFQIEQDILSSQQDLWAGYYGPKTRAKLQEIYEKHISEKEKTQHLIEEVQDIQNKSQEKAQQYIESLNSPVYWEISYEVRELQKILAQLEYFNNKDTAIFGNITKNSITQYQLDKEIIQSVNSLWAGVFWPKTQESISTQLFEMYFHEYLSENELEDFYNTHF